MTVLLVIDVQNDFCEGGSLAVKDAGKIVPVINKIRDFFESAVFTQDWHPENHKSFAANNPGKKPGDEILLGGKPQILWPVHCVQGSYGAQLQPDLLIESHDTFFKKGTDSSVDSYSAFYDNHREKSTGLAEFLRRRGVREVTLCGLATDYCVKYSVLDAIAEDFRVNVVSEACRGVNLAPDDAEKALAEMKAAGARIVSASAIR